MIERWDEFFYSVCLDLGKLSRCYSRKLGAVIARDNRILSTGFNGPPEKIPHCGKERYLNDHLLYRKLQDQDLVSVADSVCPRLLLGYGSGEGLELCPAAHAEANAIINAARIGISVIGASMYLNTCIPCKECLKLIINSGIREIVVSEVNYYDELSKFLISNSNLSIRKFSHLQIWE